MYRTQEYSYRLPQGSDNNIHNNNDNPYNDQRLSKSDLNSHGNSHAQVPHPNNINTNSNNNNINMESFNPNPLGRGGGGGGAGNINSTGNNSNHNNNRNYNNNTNATNNIPVQELELTAGPNQLKLEDDTQFFGELLMNSGVLNDSGPKLASHAHLNALSSQNAMNAQTSSSNNNNNNNGNIPTAQIAPDRYLEQMNNNNEKVNNNNSNNIQINHDNGISDGNPNPNPNPNPNVNASANANANIDPNVNGKQLFPGDPLQFPNNIPAANRQLYLMNMFNNRHVINDSTIQETLSPYFQPYGVDVAHLPMTNPPIFQTAFPLLNDEPIRRRRISISNGQISQLGDDIETVEGLYNSQPPPLPQKYDPNHHNLNPNHNQHPMNTTNIGHQRMRQQQQRQQQHIPPPPPQHTMYQQQQQQQQRDNNDPRYSDNNNNNNSNNSSRTLKPGLERKQSYQMMNEQQNNEKLTSNSTSAPTSNRIITDSTLSLRNSDAGIIPMTKMVVPLQSTTKWNNNNGTTTVTPQSMPSGTTSTNSNSSPQYPSYGIPTTNTAVTTTQQQQQQQNPLNNNTNINNTKQRPRSSRLRNSYSLSPATQNSPPPTTSNPDFLKKEESYDDVISHNNINNNNKRANINGQDYIDISDNNNNHQESNSRYGSMSMDINMTNMPNNNNNNNGNMKIYMHGNDNDPIPGTTAWKKARLLERNRIAASKCRQRKKIAQLQLQKDFDKLTKENSIMKRKLNYYEKLVSKFKKFSEAHLLKCGDSNKESLKIIEEMLMIDSGINKVDDNTGLVVALKDNKEDSTNSNSSSADDNDIDGRTNNLSTGSSSPNNTVIDGTKIVCDIHSDENQNHIL
ncbi:Cst6p NDAI_0A02710 [Naumovozyma dairenensis CBS 421]|uniref:BZIP domain-containing protein n=1 Tax=Naumovozyma dairenensis (strain ATCC 10597 / BCRC 20456 / CBS 421 / NBRC 0211 / NRRL Y-12639) TaxID=1071378 RepID=G0W3P1_NAUDC|nr:hypothetical protein NDAI_0A02710 [Naumovozyma dairenensis CBS 421]CCD22429.1 hypothetical protein NDAI_0A02710 [Naumovozyma dairenensis CBS 421]